MVIEHEKLTKCHEILGLVMEFLSIWPLNLSNLFFCLLTLRNLASVYKVNIFQSFPQMSESKISTEMQSWKTKKQSWKSHGTFFFFFFFYKVFGNPVLILDIKVKV